MASANEDARIILDVKFFARARELAGCSGAQLAAPHGTTSVTLRPVIIQHYPQLKALLPDCLLSVNLDYADPASPLVLKSGDEVGIICPVSGG